MTRPNRVWAMEITSIPMARGDRHGLEPMAVYASPCLAAVPDWFNPPRAVLAGVDHVGGRLSCIEALEEALARYGKPEIFNMEHGRAIGLSGHATSGQPIDLDRLQQGSGKPGDQDQHGLAKGRGTTTPSPGACGGPSNTKRFTCMSAPASRKPATRSGAIWDFATAAARTHRLTAEPRSGLPQSAGARRGSGITKAENHSENARNLFR